jgi:hypothetical protein
LRCGLITIKVVGYIVGVKMAREKRVRRSQRLVNSKLFLSHLRDLPAPPPSTIHCDGKDTKRNKR